MRPGERGLRVRAMLNAVANDCDNINRVPPGCALRGARAEQQK